MSNFIQLAVYGLLACILVFDGLRTTAGKENIFYKKNGPGHIPTGLLLISAGGALIVFAIRLIYHDAWTKNVLWGFIILAGIMMVWMILEQENH